MNKICTDIKQSKKLIELGIDISTADMHYSTWTILNEGEYILSPNQGETIEKLQEDYGNQIIPAWSLTALLEILPKFIGDYGKCLYFDVGGYYCAYMVDGDFMITINETNADNPIDACYEMIIELKENNIL